MASVNLSDHEKIAKKWFSDIQATLEHARSLERTANILVIGFRGHGKSSYINTLLTIFHTDRTVKHSALIRGGETGHVTVNIKPYPILDTSLHLVDLWGVEAGLNDAEESMNYSSETIDKIICGIYQAYEVMPNYQDESKQQQQRQQSHELDKRRNNKVYSVIICIDANVSPRDIGVIGGVVKKFQAKGLTVVVTMTKSDVCDPDIKKALHNIRKSEVIQEKLAKISEKLKIPPNMIFPVKCYTKERYRNKLVEYLALQPFSVALMHAKRRLCTEMIRESVKSDDEKNNDNNHNNDANDVGNDSQNMMFDDMQNDE